MTDQSAPSAKTIARLKALLALANDSRANEAEAQLAMEHAQTLMLKHNLTMATVEAAGGAAESRLKDAASKPLMFKWQQELFSAIARVNFCYFELTRKTTAGGERIVGGYEIIGRESNVIGARNMYDYLATTIARLVKQECGTSSSAQFTKFANSFRLGIVDRLRERLNQRYDEKIEEQSRAAREANAAARHPSAATSNALVVVMTDYVQQEKDHNTDVRLGRPLGTTARQREESRLESLRHDAETAAKRDALVAQGLPREVAVYMSWGYSEATARKMAEPPKPLTEAQQRREDEKARRADERWYKDSAARERRERKKVDPEGFRAGRRSGDGIGLDDQVTHAPRRKLT